MELAEPVVMAARYSVPVVLVGWVVLVVRAGPVALVLLVWMRYRREALAIWVVQAVTAR